MVVDAGLTGPGDTVFGSSSKTDERPAQRRPPSWVCDRRFRLRNRPCMPMKPIADPLLPETIRPPSACTTPPASCSAPTTSATSRPTTAASSRARCSILNGSGTMAGLRVVHRHRPGQDGAAGRSRARGASRASRSIARAVSSKCRARPVCGCADGSSSSPRASEQHRCRDVGDLARAALPAGGVVVADVFLAFHQCAAATRRPSPAGRSTRSTRRSRRACATATSCRWCCARRTNLPAASDPWAGIGATLRIGSLRRSAASLDAWTTLALPAAGSRRWHENPAGVDPTAVLLARLRIPAGRGRERRRGAGARLVRRARGPIKRDACAAGVRRPTSTTPSAISSCRPRRLRRLAGV